MDNLKELPQPFGFYRYVLKSDHLHFGLWPAGNAGLSLEEAQDNMFNHLLTFFPPPPADILDVGCGLGLSADLLAEKGYRVTAIAPSHELIDYAAKSHGKNSIEFREIGFFDTADVFASDRYDVVFFQESAQYLSPLNSAIKKARELLREGGLIIIGDEVCYDTALRSESSVHPAADFVVTLSEHGFRILEHEKIGQNVALTCDFIIHEFSSRFDEIVSAFKGSDVPETLRYFLKGWKNQKRWYTGNQMGYEIFVARKDTYFIQPYSQGDENIILPEFNRIFYTCRTMEHWQWKYRDNPYGAYKIARIFSCDGSMAAHYAGYPVPFYTSFESEHHFLSYHIGDTMTSPAVRNIGLGKTGLLARIANYYYAKYCSGQISFIYGFNTGKIRKLGMRYLSYVYIDPVAFWVLDLAKKTTDRPSLLTRLFSGYKIEEVYDINEEWDFFFDKVSDSYQLLVHRDATYVRWRYLDCPDKTHRIFSVRQKGQLIGWSVFTKKGNTIIWGDAFFDRNHPQAVNHLLSSICANEFTDCVSIEGWFSLHPEWWSGLIRKLGFEITPEPNELTPCFVIFNDPSMFERLQQYFYYTMGDSDLF